MEEHLSYKDYLGLILIAASVLVTLRHYLRARHLVAEFRAYLRKRHPEIYRDADYNMSRWSLFGRQSLTNAVFSGKDCGDPVIRRKMAEIRAQVNYVLLCIVGTWGILALVIGLLWGGTLPPHG